MPSKRFPLVYADPSMAYRDTANAGKRGAAHKYPTMLPIENAVEIHRIAAPDATLFCWKTWPTHHELHEMLRATGWRYRTVGFVWVKLTTRGNLASGMGHWTAANTEFVEIYTRGRHYPRPAHPLKVHQVVLAPVGEHSAKPAIIREHIVRLMGDMPRIEMFARERVDGWAAHGLEVDARLEGHAHA